MAREEGLHEFMWGIYRYHGEAVSYRCPCCGYEKLGTCMVQFWEDDIPAVPENQETECPNVSDYLPEESETVKEEQPEKVPANNKQSFFAHVTSRIKVAFQGAAREQKEAEKETEEETLQPDKSDEPEQKKEVPKEKLNTEHGELQEFRPKQASETRETDNPNSSKNCGKVTLQKENDQNSTPKKTEAAAKDSNENKDKPDQNVPTEEAKPESSQNLSVTECKNLKKNSEKQEISNKEAAPETVKTVQDTSCQTDIKEEGDQKKADGEKEPQELEKVPKMFTEVKGKPALSDEWIAYMFEHHPKRFTAWFNRFASKQQKERHYLNTHVPKISVIMNDILYDTEKAEQYLTEEKNIRDGKMKVFYYRMPAGYFFKILSIMGRSDELVTMEKKEVKKLLGKRPDIYRKIIPDEIKE